MRENRSRVIYACLLVAESCWLYALAGVVGIIAGQSHSPLPWLGVFALVGAGMYAGWLTMGMRGDPATLAIVLGLSGLACVYLTLAGGAFNGGRYDMTWAAKLIGGGLEARAAAGAVVGLAAAILLWRRAITLVADRYVEERLQRSFKLGMAVVAIAVLTEMVSGRDIGAKTLPVPFFGVSLAGLAVARLPEHGVGARTATWVRVIAVSVLGVIGTGLLLGLAGGVYGTGGVNLLYRGWGLVVDGLLWLIRYPLQLIVNAMLAFWSWVRNILNPSGERAPLDPLSPPQFPLPDSAPAGPGGPSVADHVIQILQYPLLAVLIIAIFLTLALAFRRIWHRRREQVDEDRERIEADEDSADMAGLLKGLLPSWLRRARGPEYLWRYPAGEAGTADVFRLYFDYLSEGIRRGMKFDPAVTPAERAPTLAAVLPGAPVNAVTERFNAACYGHEPTDAVFIGELRTALAAASAQPRASNGSTKT